VGSPKSGLTDASDTSGQPEIGEMVPMPFRINPRRRAAVILLAGLLAIPALRADLIVLRDGHEYDGELVAAEQDFVRFRVTGQKEQTFPRADVVHVRLQSALAWAGCRTAADIPDPLFQDAWKAPRDPRRWPGADRLLLLSLDCVRLRTPQTWEREHRTITAVLKESGENASLEEETFRPDSERMTVVHGVTVRPDGTVLALRDTAVQLEAPLAGQPRYDTLRRRRFALPEGKPGNLLDAAWRLERFQPRPEEYFVREFRFGGTAPARRIRVEVEVPEACGIRWALLNDPARTVTHRSEPLAGGGRRHVWERADAPQLLPEPMMPPLNDLVPLLVVSAGPASWQEAGAGFAAALQALDRRWPDAALPAAPARDVAGLWAAVSRQVAPAEVPPEATGPLPGDPGETWRLRQGAPIDRTYLLYRWLRAAGHPARWAWIRPRNQGALCAATPNLSLLPKPVIVLDGPAPQWLVPGDDLDGFGEPAAAQAGAAALVPGRDTAPAALPASLMTAAPGGIRQDILVRLDDAGDAQVLHTIVRSGAEARPLREWRRLTAAERRREAESLARDADGQARDIRFRLIGDPAANAPALTLELAYAIPGFADRREQLVSVRPPWLAFEATEVGRDQPRRFPLFWNEPRRQVVALEILPPARFRLHAGPDASSLVRAGFAFHCETAQRPNGGVRCTATYERTALTAAAATYPEFKQCLELRAASGRQYWVWRQAQ